MTGKTNDKRPRGGQPGNRNACSHGFYAGSLAPRETAALEAAAARGDTDPEAALIRARLESALRLDPGNRRVLQDAASLLTKRYGDRYNLDGEDRVIFRKFVIGMLEAIADKFAECSETKRD